MKIAANVWGSASHFTLTTDRDARARLESGIESVAPAGTTLVYLSHVSASLVRCMTTGGVAAIMSADAFPALRPGRFHA